MRINKRSRSKNPHEGWSGTKKIPAEHLAELKQIVAKVTNWRAFCREKGVDYYMFYYIIRGQKRRLTPAVKMALKKAGVKGVV